MSTPSQPVSAPENGIQPFPRPSTRQITKPAVPPYFGGLAGNPRTVAITLAAEPWSNEAT